MQWDESPTVLIDMPQPHIILTVVLSPNMGDVISTLLVNIHEDNNLVRCRQLKGARPGTASTFEVWARSHSAL